ncbi:MAG: hypothetical protein RR325_04860 [Bacilli bacterium]
MKYIKRLLFMLIITFFISNVDATSKCEYKEQAELNSMVANIKTSYEEKEGILDRNEYPIPDSILGTPEEETYVGKYNYFGVNIINLTNKFYIVVSNNVNQEIKTFNYSDAKEGIISFDWSELSIVTTFTLKVYSSNETNCDGELYRTIYLTTPRINEYYGYDLCEGANDYYLCQKYVTFNTVSFEAFEKQINDYKNEEKTNNDKNDKENKDKWYVSVSNFVKEHKVIFIVSGVSLVVISGVVIAVIVKKRRSSDL